MNPLHMCYKAVPPVSYNRATAVYVAHTNRLNPAFQVARKAGVELLGYMNIIDIDDVRVSPLWEDLHMGDRTKVPRWLGADGKPLVNWPGSQLADIRSEAYVSHLLSYLGARMIDGMLDGFFMDVIGGQLWGAAWNAMSPADRLEWQNAAVSFMRRLDALRQQLNPDFIIVNNNTWQYAPEGEKYVDGVCIEGHDSRTNPYVANYANRIFGSGKHRRVFAITAARDSAVAWTKVVGLTHVCQTDVTGDGKSDGYAIPSPPVPEAGYVDLFRQEAIQQIATLQRQRLDLQYDLATAQGERAAAIQQRDAAEKRVDAATTAYEQASAREDAANSALAASNSFAARLLGRLDAIKEIAEAP